MTILNSHSRFKWLAAVLLLLILYPNYKTNAQQVALLTKEGTKVSSAPKPILVSTLPNYYDPQDGVSLNDLIRRALETNQDLAANRIEIEKAKARLDQALLRPNPTLEFEQESGRLVGNGGDSANDEQGRNLSQSL